MKNKTIILVIAVVAFLAIFSLSYFKSEKKMAPTNSEQTKTGLEYKGKKVLYIDSYHEGYAWSDGITNGVRSVLDGSGADWKIHRMDTKRNPSDDFKKQAALTVKSEIENYNPDVVIVSDDNAFKYLVMPYYRDAELPFVFCGLNWDASVYEAPYSNTTGMVEVSLTVELIDMLKEYAKGERTGYLTADVLTERKNAEYYSRIFGLDFDKKYFVTTMEDWKEAFLKLQDEVDIVIFENNAGIVDWSDEAAEAFVLENVRVPVGTTNPWIMQSSLLGMTKVPEEQGEWSAEAALQILDGTPAKDISVVTNKRGKIFVNLKAAEKLGVVLRPDILKHAEIVQ